MSTPTRLPWLSSSQPAATTAPMADHPAAETETGAPLTHRRELLKLLGAGGLLIAANALGVRRLAAQDTAFDALTKAREAGADVLLLTQGLDDHAHRPTLRALAAAVAAAGAEPGRL